MEALRLEAEVVDKFSDPMKRLRTQLQVLGKEGKEHGRTLGEGFTHAERAMAKTAGTVTNVLNPALSSIGVTTLGVTAALAGIQAAVRSFTTNASGLGQLGRDTGIAAEQLRDIQSVLGKVGIDANQSSAGIIAFAEAARQARGGVGPLMDFLRTQGKTTEGRAYFGGIADSLIKSKDAGEAFMKAFKGLEGIKDPADRRVYAEQVLRMAEAARVVEKHRGTIDEQMAKANKEAGPLTPQMVQSAEAYDKAMSGLATTMKRIGTAIAMELEGPLAKVAVTMKSFLDDERKGVTPAIVQTIRDAVTYIESIDWNGAFARLREGFGEVKTELGGAFTQLRDLMAEFSTKGSGDAVSGVFKEIGAAANDTARAIRAVALSIGVLKDLKNLDFSEAGKKLAEIDRATDAGIGKRSNAEPTKKLTPEAEAMLGTITGGKPEDAAKAQREAETYRREQGKLTDEMRRLREALPDKKPGEATVQQQSFDASTAPALGGLIQKASFGAMGAMAGVGNSMAGLGGRGLTAQGDPHAMDRFRAFLENRGYRGNVPEAMRGVGRALGEAGRQRQESYGGGAPSQSGPFPNRNFGGGRFGGLGGSPLVTRPDGPAERVGRALRGEPQDTGPRVRSQGSVPKEQDARAQRAMARLIARGWTPEAASTAIGQAVEESGVRSDGPLGDTERFGRGDDAAHGMFQWRAERFRALKKFAEGRNVPWTDFDAQVDFFDEETKRRSTAAERNWRNETDLGRGNRIGQIFEGYKGPLQAQRERHARRQLDLYRRGGVTLPEIETTADRPDRSKVGPEAGADFDRAKRFYGDKAEPGQLRMFSDPRFNDMRNSLRGMRRGKDGLGAANETLGGLAEQRAKNEEDMRGIGKAFASINESPAMRKALKSGVAGGPTIKADTQVGVIINKAGPDTTASTTVGGSLFRDVKLNRGATMARASQEN
ncbi:phage tail tip lysozyme [Methylobacterium sp. J-090]|uniref:phage tail tip lysozyme n=1 Tax=Methylobacterium sp. J-090 TaxID=2836666 RepID=UPI001FBBE6F7|nr:phage tail tip lysozyme [Methylobacterium sp. J-090]MCJ2082689.1 phage tail tip lysozyme [Methylobacterium sp. J-090]